ncbi:hypothetical protein KM295_14610 [Natronomonas sp. F2-12]|uniref:Uncharacterized protein n=1 Tax=Natronomonas aquatica TaxID=2841590 RepID=A0A9R1D7F0_9EURY|nr:hypothetical protein [Natronomonas aquatica]MCQ4334687.1 hypothetical protein [Natronomonas aquatica]
MATRRRTFLTALAGIAVVGGGYSQRRRIQRRDDVAAIGAALEIDRPTPEAAVSVRPEHATAAHERASGHVTGTERLRSSESGDGDRDDDALEEARQELDEYAPETLEGDGARLEALDAYRLAIARSATVRGRLYGDGRGNPSPELRRRIDSLEADLGAFEPAYSGGEIPETIVQCAEADERYRNARSDLEAAVRMADGEEYANDVAWEQAAVGSTRLYDARQFLRDREGPDRTDALGSAFDRLTGTIAEAIDGMEWRYDDAHASYPATRFRDAGLAERADPQRDPGPGRLASAVRSRARQATVAVTLGRFGDVPARSHWEELGYELGTAAGTVSEARAAAVGAIEATADAVGSDPLARWLLSDILGTVASADRRLSRLADDPNAGNERWWTTRYDRSVLEYRAAEAESEAIPTVLARIEGR